MDAILFVLIFLTLLAQRSGPRWLALTLYLASLTGTLLLFAHHASDSLPLAF